jgi:hypothetical protein
MLKSDLEFLNELIKHGGRCPAPASSCPHCLIRLNSKRCNSFSNTVKSALELKKMSIRNKITKCLNTK